MPIDTEEIIEKTLEHAFAKAFEQSIQTKAEELFERAFANGSPFAQRLEQKIAEEFQRFFDQGLR